MGRTALAIPSILLSMSALSYDLLAADAVAVIAVSRAVVEWRFFRNPTPIAPLSTPIHTTEGTIWQTLSLDPSFSLLVAALNATSLPETLDSKGGTASYTIFAPDNDAIRATPDFPGGMASPEMFGCSIHV